MTKKEITKRLLKDETCNNCKYCNIVQQCSKDEKKNVDLPKELTCEQFEKGQWTRKLKVTWSQQAYQDIKAWTTGPSAEEEITKAVGEEMKKEIDRMYLNGKIHGEKNSP
jgi:hypothetical protein